MARYDDQNRRLCNKTTRAGNPCRAPALKGGLVCNKHGGSLPNVKAKAARVLLEELIDPALNRLTKLVEDDSLPAQVHLGASKLVLEMTGFKVPTQVEVIPPLAVINDWIEELEAEEL